MQESLSDEEQTNAKQKRKVFARICNAPAFFGATSSGVKKHGLEGKKGKMD